MVTAAESCNSSDAEVQCQCSVDENPVIDVLTRERDVFLPG